MLAAPTAVDFVEALAENHLEPGSVAGARLAAIAGVIPVVGHGVSLDLGGPQPLDRAHLQRLRRWLHDHRVGWYTDHLCWSRAHGRPLHELLPLPYAPELVPYVAARVRAAQAALGVPFGVENVSSYLGWARDAMPEWAFYRQVVEAADAWMLLDLNNVYVSSQNHGFDPLEYLHHLPWERVLVVHLAGHQRRPDGLLHDTHDQPVAPAVWALYREAWRLGGPFPTLLEWDDQIPPLPVLLDALDHARAVRGA